MPDAYLMQLDECVVPCHMTINFEKRSFDKATPCVGAMQFMNNIGKVSRVPIVAYLQKLFGKNDKVFKFRHEFIEHHSKKISPYENH